MDHDAQAIERLRELLRAQVSPPLQVTDQRRGCWFDEDSAAFSEIDVRDPSADRDGFVMVVIRAFSSPSADAFAVKVWLQRACEVWTVGSAAITKMTRDGTRVVLREEQVLTSPVLPGVAIPVHAVWR